MANPVITDVNTGGPVLSDVRYEDDTFTAGGAGTTVAGTILARDSVSGNLVVFVKGGSTNENGIPKRITTVDIVATGAGDLPVRVAASGKFYKTRLVIDADGDDSNIDKVVIDQLLDYGMEAVVSQNLSVLDNS